MTCALHLAEDNSTQLHAGISQSCLRLASAASTSQQAMETLQIAASHAHLVVRCHCAGADQLLVAVHSLLCASQLDSVADAVGRLKRMSGINCDALSQLHDIALAAGHGEAAYGLSCALLTNLLARQASGDSATYSSLDDEQLLQFQTQLLQAHTQVLTDGLRLLGPDVWRAAANLACFLSCPSAFKSALPASNKPKSVLPALAGHVQALRSLMHTMVAARNKVRLPCLCRSSTNMLWHRSRPSNVP
jgi:hypothetical protein